MKSILFVDKSFLKPPATHLRGVELFNLNLIRDLDSLNFNVFFVAEKSWEEILKRELSLKSENYIFIPHFFSDAINMLIASIVVLFKKKKCKLLLLGNVGNGIIYGVSLLKKFSLIDDSLVIAHREASAKFVKLAKSLKATIVSVNRQITKPFIEIGLERVFIDYGILNSDLFFKDEEKKQDEKIHFCLLGMLDNAWKGADTAINAFRKLPKAIKEKSVLHLASYSNPPKFEDENIIAYSWFDYNEIPKFLRKMDVSLVLSRDEHIMRETFSQAIVQAMLSELPVIATNLEIFEEKLKDGAGLIANDESQLLNFMTMLAEEPQKRAELGKKARQVALERYVWNTKKFVSRYVG